MPIESPADLPKAQVRLSRPNCMDRCVAGSNDVGPVGLADEVSRRETERCSHLGDDLTDRWIGDDARRCGLDYRRVLLLVDQRDLLSSKELRERSGLLGQRLAGFAFIRPGGGSGSAARAASRSACFFARCRFLAIF